MLLASFLGELPVRDLEHRIDLVELKARGGVNWKRGKRGLFEQTVGLVGV